jgi:hypothetical protein
MRVPPFRKQTVLLYVGYFTRQARHGSLEHAFLGIGNVLGWALLQAVQCAGGLLNCLQCPDGFPKKPVARDPWAGFSRCQKAGGILGGLQLLGFGKGPHDPDGGADLSGRELLMGGRDKQRHLEPAR